MFQVHGIDAEDRVIIRRQLKRRYVLAFFEKLPQCLIGIEACASSHYWSREHKALGHAVRLMPPAYVKPYVKRQKNDARSEEHTSELQSLTNLVCRLLLEAGVKFDLAKVEFPSKKTSDGEDFLAVNPKGANDCGAGGL